MANDTKKQMEVREGRVNYSSHDKLIERSKKSGDYGVRTDAYAEGVGYLGMDDIDRMRRHKLK